MSYVLKLHKEACMISEELKKIQKIQSFWRGYKTRKYLKRQFPKTNNPSTYLTFVTGNEPEIITNKIAGYFVYIGTSGLKNLHNINQLISTFVDSEDGYTHIPKLYIIDNSENVIDFWRSLKELLVKSEDITSFKENVDSNIDSFQLVCLAGNNISREILDNFYALTGIQNLEKDAKNPDAILKYTFFRNIVCKATFICEDWLNSYVFNYIKERTGRKVPIVVYSSNIAEYICADKAEAPSTRLEEIRSDLESLIHNILILEPKLIIHTRSDKKSSCLRPKNVIMIEDHRVEAHLEKLCADSFRDIFKDLKLPNKFKN